MSDTCVDFKKLTDLMDRIIWEAQVERLLEQIKRLNETKEEREARGREAFFNCVYVGNFQ